MTKLRQKMENESERVMPCSTVVTQNLFYPLGPISRKVVLVAFKDTSKELNMSYYLNGATLVVYNYAIPSRNGAQGYPLPNTRG